MEKIEQTGEQMVRSLLDFYRANYQNGSFGAFMEWIESILCYNASKWATEDLFSEMERVVEERA
jgi:hypothetical protein